jgi:hypothetical protein
MVCFGEIQRLVKQSPGLAREEGDKMVACGDEKKIQADDKRSDGGGKRHRGAAVSAVPDGKDVPLLHLAGLAENV